MNCQVCGRRRQRRTLGELALPVTFVVNYQTGEAREFPAGTLFCEMERRKLLTSMTDGQRIVFKDGAYRRAEDGEHVIRSWVLTRPNVPEPAPLAGSGT
jgi:hypothetical protein